MSRAEINAVGTLMICAVPVVILSGAATAWLGVDPRFLLPWLLPFSLAWCAGWELWMFRRLTRIDVAKHRGDCPTCGHQVPPGAEQERCPECGTDTPGQS